jgi:DNA-binding transcriptional MerR regulator
MKIGQASKQAGIGVEAIRYYETRGVIRRPPRPEKGR